MPSKPSRRERPSDQIRKSLDRIETIQFLAARTLRNDPKYTLFTNSPAQLFSDLALVFIGKSTCLKIEHQRDAAADLVHILTARSAASGRGEAEFSFGNIYTRKNMNHEDSALTSR